MERINKKMKNEIVSQEVSTTDEQIRMHCISLSDQCSEVVRIDGKKIYSLLARSRLIYKFVKGMMDEKIDEEIELEKVVRSRDAEQ